MLFAKQSFRRRFGRPGKNKKRKQRIFWQFQVSGEVKNGIIITGLVVLAVLLFFSFIGRAGVMGASINAYLGALLAGAKWVLFIAPVLLLASIGLSGKKGLDAANYVGVFLFVFGGISLWSYFNNTVRLAGFWMPGLNFYLGEAVSAISSGALLVAGVVMATSIGLSQLVGRDSLLLGLLKAVLVVLSKPFIRSEYWDEEDEEDGATPLALSGTPPRGGRLDKEEAGTPPRGGRLDKEEAGTPPIPLRQGFAGREGGRPERDKEEKSKQGVVRDYQPLISDVSKGKLDLKIPLQLLNSRPAKPQSGNIAYNQSVIKNTLADFGIPVAMGEVMVGPTVTQYTLKPERGISVTRLKPLQDDLALNLATHPVRLEVPIPGKSLVGVEIPNQSKVTVSLKEILKSGEFKNTNSSLTLPLGRDIGGGIWIDDLAKMPHLLVAGATGSGKSVGLHAFLLSLMYQNSPDELKMILIDVKQVELSKYDDLPYLIAPVVTDSKRAIRALRWAVGEMDKRLGTLKEANCQNIAEYNRKKKQKMPYLVIAVDELGDLLCTAKREAEGAIIRLGQKARAAGIHLILATQRPSVDVVSGLIKANLPARIAFSVTSAGNSKTILDFTGAEKLLGQGDMLYINSALSKPVRIQGAFVGKEEIKAVTAYIKKKVGKAKFEKDLLGGAPAQLDLHRADGDFQDDELKQKAIELITQYKKASATMLQSRLGIGYPKATRILDELEQDGLVGPSVQNKPREVLVR